MINLSARTEHVQWVLDIMTTSGHGEKIVIRLLSSLGNMAILGVCDELEII